MKKSLRRWSVPSFLRGHGCVLTSCLDAFGSQYAGVRNGRDDAHHDY